MSHLPHDTASFPLAGKQRFLRNFSIIAHIDHGKTTLTDCFLRLTNTLGEGKIRERMMDSNPIEQERGITIKLAPARMLYEYQGEVAASAGKYILNLIDTPGHVDFSYEVSRSLAACEGVLLVVDATQGIQAQTLSHFEKARALGLTIIPVINKVDLPSADLEGTMFELMELCQVDEKNIITVSAKSGLNVQAVLDAIVERIPAPSGDPTGPLRSLLVTSHYDQHRGAIGLVRVVDGTLKREKLQFITSGTAFLPVEIGVFNPDMTPTDELQVGEVGYVATGLKDIRYLKIGDTLTSVSAGSGVPALPGYNEPRPMVYMEIFPIDADDFTMLQDAMSKLALRDAALQYSGTNSIALGSGLRVGFLGILHAEIVLERLKREFDMDIIATLPSVTYQILTTTGEEQEIKTPGEMPDPSVIKEIREPIAKLIVFTPVQYMSDVLNLCRDRRGEFVASTFVGQRVYLECRLPFAELITDFHDVLKSVTSGYASLEYELSGYVTVDAVKVTIFLNHEPIEALSFITVREQAEREGRSLVSKLKDVLPRQMFEVPIQAAIGGSVVARETIKAFRKDVTAKLYGGDVTRRQKLLKKQAKGKQRMKRFGKVEIDQNTFLAVLRR
jgi:GTP-binding protein LepA